MTFSQVVQDIKKLIGLELCSIKPGSNITLLEVDEERNNLTLLTSQGTKRSRPLSELKTIWDEMMLHPAVHVDEVLHGSGTSRNQPETILANLPYVEWLKITNKKHISYVSVPSHAFGTLKQMDPVTAANMLEGDHSTPLRDFSMVIVSNDIPSDLALFKINGIGKETAIEQGAYLFNTGKKIILFISSSKTNLVPGMYCVLDGINTITFDNNVTLLNKTYSLIVKDTLRILIKDALK